jgi:glucose/arabinose dehydrogenase
VNAGKQQLWLLVAIFGVVGAASPADLPLGFVEEKVADGISGATGMAVARDGRIFVCEQTGALRVVKNGTMLEDPFLRLEVDSFWERGLIGVTSHPQFPEKPFVFVVYVTAKPYPHHRISRFTAEGDRAKPASELVLLEGDNQNEMAGTIKAGHQGGGIHFDVGGKLYVAIGEQTAGAPSQRLDTLLGKMLRLNPEGGIPEDNPFFSATQGKYRAIWALGLRNPFAFAVQARTGRIFINDVGGSAWEEINEGKPGANYGWPTAEGYSTNSQYRNPIHAYRPTMGRSISGGVFYNPGVAQFPTQYVGKYFFQDYMNNWMRVLDPEHPQDIATFARNLSGPVAVDLGPDGSLYYLNRSAWVKDEKWKPNTGSLYRIRYVGQPAVSASEIQQARAEAHFPRWFSNSDWWRQSGMLRYEVNCPVWLPGLQAERWIRLPAGKSIGFHKTAPWRFPSETAFLKHLYAGERRIETQVIVAGERCFSAASYKWRPDASDAELVEDAVAEAVVCGNKQINWHFPGVDDCVSIQAGYSGFFLEIGTAQLNRDVRDPETGQRTNQLMLWNRNKMFESPLQENELQNLNRMAQCDDSSASDELKVRSYLAANCAMCHFPEGPSRGAFDARFETPLARQNLIRAEPLAGDLGVAGAKIVFPGQPEKSILYQRIKRFDLYRMPPAALNDLESPILPILERWIRELK